MSLTNEVLSQITNVIDLFIKNHSYTNNTEDFSIINWDEIKFKISSLDLPEFLELISCIFKLKNFNLNNSYSLSCGKRIYLYKDKEYYILECRIFANTNSLCTPIAIDLKNYMIKNKISKAFIASTGKFSKECISYCKLMNIELLSIDDIIFTLQCLDKHTLSLVLNHLNNI